MTKTGRTGVLAAGCGMLLMLAGCAAGLRFYSDGPRPSKDVALVLVDCRLDGITGEGRPKMDLVGNEGTLSELLPGDYVLDLRYVYQSAYLNRRGANVEYPLKAAAGHVYYVYPEFPTGSTWRPAVVDISSEEDYRKIPDRTPDSVKKMVARYFSGPRAVAKKEEIPTNKGVITLWR